MKLTSMKICICLFYALGCLFLMGVCPGGALCSWLDGQADLGHVVGQECCGHEPIEHESVLRFECTVAEHSKHECCRNCSDSSFHFGCDRELVLPNQTKPMAFSALACTGVITNDVGLGQDGFLSQLPSTGNTALSLLRTVILLT